MAGPLAPGEAGPVTSPYMTGAKRIVSIGASSAVGVRDDDRPAGVAHAMPRLNRERDDLALCGSTVIPLPHQDWRERTVGVLRCRSCEDLTR
jgi:hypothetical protein